MNGHLISRPAYVTRCPHCGDCVLVAIDCGLTITAAITTLGIHAEIAALLTGLITYDLIYEPGCKTYLISRDTIRIKARRGYPVVATHKCPDGRKPVVTWDIPPRRPHAARKPAAYDPREKVPF